MIHLRCWLREAMNQWQEKYPHQLCEGASPTMDQYSHAPSEVAFKRLHP